MKTVNATPDHNGNQSLNPAEEAAWAQFAASDRSGQALFHPLVEPGAPAPGCVVFLEGIGRFAIRFMPGPYSLANGQWRCHHDGGAAVPVADPLEETWQAAAAVRAKLRRELDIGAYVIPVAMFPDMEMDEDILTAAQGRSVRVLCGQGNEVQRLVNLPDEQEAYLQFERRFIEREVAALSRPSSLGEAVLAEAAEEELPEEALPEVAGRTGALVLERAETVNIYVTIVNGGTGAEPPLLTVQGR